MATMSAGSSGADTSSLGAYRFGFFRKVRIIADYRGLGVASGPDDGAGRRNGMVVMVAGQMVNPAALQHEREQLFNHFRMVEQFDFARVQMRLERVIDVDLRSLLDTR